MKKDILNREEYVNQLLDIIECISDRSDNYCFAIDGKWGVGKTYILEMLEAKLEEIQLEETADNKYFVFHYNCWEYDYYDEAAIAIISSMLTKIEQEEKLLNEKASAAVKASWEQAKQIVGQIAGEFSKNKIGIDVVEIYRNIKEEAGEIIEDNHAFDKLYSFKKTLNNAREKLKELAQTKSIVFIVDELDRCLPEYAIKVMERIHHLFDGIENITVILSVDSNQLNHSIKMIYGDAVDVDKYLKKFIDFVLLLDDGQLSIDFQEKYSDYFDCFEPIKYEDKTLFFEMFEAIFWGIDIRTQEKIISKASLIHNLIKENKKYDVSLLCFEIMYLILALEYNNSDVPYNITNLLRSNNNNDKASVKGVINYFTYTDKLYTDRVYRNIFDDISYKELTNTFIGKAGWMLLSIHNKIQKENCDKSHLAQSQQPSKEVSLARKFAEISKIVL